MNIIHNVEQFNRVLDKIGSGKNALDMQCQRAAEYCITQSIEHSNADAGMRLVKTLQQVKYGNVSALVKYLCIAGHFAVADGKMVFSRETLRDIPAPAEKAIWKDHAKVERIEQPKVDGFVYAEVQRLIKSVKAWAELHPENKVSDAVLNKLTEVLPENAAVAA